MDAVSITFLFAGFAFITYALAALAYEFTLVFSGRESGSLSRLTRPHIFWRAAFAGAALIVISFAITIFQALM